MSDEGVFFFVGKIVRFAHADAQYTQNRGAIGCQNGHRQRTGDLGFLRVRSSDPAEVLLQIAEFDRFATRGRCAGDAFAERDERNFFEQDLRNADLRQQGQIFAIGQSSVDGAGLARKLLEGLFEKSVKIEIHGGARATWLDSEISEKKGKVKVCDEREQIGCLKLRAIFLTFFLRKSHRWVFVLQNTVHQMIEPSLTKRQQEILEYLKSAQRTTGIMPSTRELQHYFGFASQTAAMSHLRALEKKGAIQRLPGKARAVAFPDELDREEIIDIPIYGRIAAGYGDDTTPEKEGCVSIDIRSLGLQRSARTFALKVRGESMVDAHICDGDVVIMEFRTPKNGDIVAALIDGETTLKRYVVENGKPFLHAENKDFPDLIPARELIVQGVLVALLRQAA